MSAVASICSSRFRAVFSAASTSSLRARSADSSATSESTVERSCSKSSASKRLDITAGDVVMLSAYFTSIVNAIIALTSLGAVITKGLQSVRSLGEILESPDLEMNEGKAEVSKVSG